MKFIATLITLFASIQMNTASSNDTFGTWGPGSFINLCYHNGVYLGNVSPLEIHAGLTCEDKYTWKIIQEHNVENNQEYVFKYIFRNGEKVPVHQKVHSVEDCVVSVTPLF